MCGITGFISNCENIKITDILIKSLLQLENRGYDSTGIAILEDQWNIYKSISNNSLDELNNLINNKNSYMGIGHTRWATHGGITIDNTHPHISMNKKIILVHNGIINNYNTLKNELIKNDYKFYSETDTEIIANYIEYILINNDNNILKSIEIVNTILEGTWALAIIYIEEPEKIYLTNVGLHF